MNCQHVCKALLFWLLVEVCAKRSFSMRNTAEDVISCSPTCSERRNMKVFYGASCSCTRSCLTYGDCCRDAPYKNTGANEADLRCLTLYGLGPVSVVNNCPSSSSMQMESCAKGQETSTPVTSLETGVSYSTYDCAVCNNDSNSLVKWPVQLRCCPDEEGTTAEEEIDRERLQYQNTSYATAYSSKVEKVSNASCDCGFYSQNDLTFVISLQLRNCTPVMISTCSSTWKNDNIRKLCSSYLDQVYIGEKIYRNSHCAVCNHENIEMLKCSVLHSSQERLKRHQRQITSQQKPPCREGEKLHPKRNKCVKYTI